jgi:WD40 repeat protein
MLVVINRSIHSQRVFHVARDVHTRCCETLEGHTDQVYRIEWAPFNESILASCSDDRRVGVWDLSRIGTLLFV